MVNVIMPGIGIVIFFVVLVVTWTVLPKMGFRGLSRAALAFCVAALSVLGLDSGYPVRLEGDPPSGIGGILIPYAALGITLLILILLWLFGIGLEWIRSPGQRSGNDIGESESDTHRDW